MSIIDIALIDDEVDYCTAFECMAKKDEELHFVGSAHNGHDAVKLIKRTLPDVVFLDNYLVNEDSGCVIQRIRDLKLLKNPKIIVICSLDFPLLPHIAKENGADLFLYKEYGHEVLFSRCKTIAKISHPRLDNLIEEKKEITKDPEKLVFNILRELGVPPHLKGHEYLTRAILMVLDDFKIATSITKLIYPDIARATNTSAWNVERAMRSAIQTSWNRSNSEVFMDYFKPFIDKTKGRPTNSEFVTTVAQIVKNYCE